jgi:hypothetical protein
MSECRVDGDGGRADGMDVGLMEIQSLMAAVHMAMLTFACRVDGTVIGNLEQTKKVKSGNLS